MIELNTTDRIRLREARITSHEVEEFAHDPVGFVIATLPELKALQSQAEELTARANDLHRENQSLHAQVEALIETNANYVQSHRQMTEIRQALINIVDGAKMSDRGIATIAAVVESHIRPAGEVRR